MDNSGDPEPEEKPSKKAKKSKEAKPVQSRLDTRLQDLISLICDVSMMKQQMVEIGYDARKMPLGKLSVSTIQKGYGVLKRIAAVLEGQSRESLSSLSGEFYTVIPHDFGFKHMSNFIIDDKKKLKAKLDMVEALGNIEVAQKLLTHSISDTHPLDQHYEKLDCDLEPLDSNSEEVEMIKQYVRETHAATHNNYKLVVEQVFRLNKQSEQSRFAKYARNENRMLLWHGSRLTNWTGIISQGLRIAPPEAPSTGYMFGKGVYFAGES